MPLLVFSPQTLPRSRHVPALYRPGSAAMVVFGLWADSAVCPGCGAVTLCGREGPPPLTPAPQLSHFLRLAFLHLHVIYEQKSKEVCRLPLGIGCGGW